MGTLHINILRDLTKTCLALLCFLFQLARVLTQNNVIFDIFKPYSQNRTTAGEFRKSFGDRIPLGGRFRLTEAECCCNWSGIKD